MEAIPYTLRVRLSDDVPHDGQLCVMRRIPQFDGPELCRLPLVPRPAPKTVRAAVFNVEHGYRIREIADFLEACPELADADILFGNEFDDGTERSGNINASRALAERLGFQYAYALEFIELVNPADTKGYEGNTLFSRWPIVRAESLYLPEGYNWPARTSARSACIWKTAPRPKRAQNRRRRSCSTRTACSGTCRC